MTTTDKQLVDALREAGHAEAADLASQILDDQAPEPEATPEPSLFDRALAAKYGGEG